MNLLTGKLNKTHIKIIFVISYIILNLLFDVYFYGYIYQQKIKKENFKNEILTCIFEESETSDKEDGIVTVPRYRIIQKIIETGGIIIILYYCGIWSAIGILLTHYFMTYDLLFYIVLEKTHLFTEFDKLYQPYWLTNWYQSGYFILKPFSSIYFYMSGFTGLVAALMSVFIGNRKKK